MLDGVVQQIASQLCQHPFMRCQWRGDGGNVKVNIFICDQCRQIQRYCAHHACQIERFKVRLLAQLFNLCQRQHLVGHKRGAVHRLVDVGQRSQRLLVASHG